MIHVHLYGKLRRFTDDRDARSDSIVDVSWKAGYTVLDVINRIGIPRDEIGSNVFLNGRYALLTTSVSDGDRLGLFPDDMQLLYKWYFAPNSSSAAPNLNIKDPAAGSGTSESNMDVGA